MIKQCSRGAVVLHIRSSTPGDQGNDKNSDGNEEKNFGKSSRTRSNTAKSKYCGNNSDDEKGD